MDQTIRIIVDSTGAERGTRVVNRDLGKMRKEARGATTDVDKIRGAFNRTGKSATGFSREINTSASAIAGLGKNILGGAGIVFGVAAIGSAFADAIRVQKEFQKSISELSAITGATGQDLAFLTDESKRLGSTTTLTASQVATGFKLIASAKPDLLENAQALSEVTEQAITLAEAAGIELPDAAKALGSSLNQFQLEAEESARVINVLAAGSQKGASEIPQLTQALKVAGTVAAGAGLSFESTVANLETLAEVNIKGAEAGTNLRNVILRLQKQGIDAINPKIVGLSQAFRNLNELQLTDIELLKIFGDESFAAAQALAARTQRTDELTASITDTNTAQEQAATNTDNLDSDLKRLDSAYEGLQLSLTEGFTPALRSATQFTANFINVIGEAVTSVNQFSGEASDFLGDLFSTNDSVLRSLSDASVATIEDRIRAENQVLNNLNEANQSILNNVNDVLSLGITEAQDRGAIQDQEKFIEDLKRLRDARRDLDNAGSEVLGPSGSGLSEADKKTALEQLRGGRAKANEADKEAARLAKEATRDADRQAAALQKIRDELDPIGQATREYTEDLTVLNRALKEGVITEEQFNKANEQLSETFEDARDPLAAFNEKLDEEAALIKLSSQEREVELSVRQAVADLQRQGLELTDAEIEGLRQRTAANQAANEVADRQSSLLQSIKGSSENFAEEQADINDLFSDGELTLGEYNTALDDLRGRQLAASTDLASGFERGFDSAKESFNDFASTSEQATTSLFSNMQSGLASFVKTGKADFSSLKDSIIDSIIQIGTQAAISEIFFGGGGGASAGGGGGSGGGGTAGAIASIAGAFFGASGSGGSTASFGDGGIQNTETLARIAEKGPEAIIPLKGGNVPVQISDSGRRTTLVNNFNITTPNPDSFRSSQNQIMTAAGSQLERVMSRNG